jgi:hypothetical protein
MNRVKKFFKDHKEDISAIAMGAIAGVIVSAVTYKVAEFNMSPTEANMYSRGDGASLIEIKLQNGKHVSLFRAPPTVEEA